jgi:hypothetical protein
MSEPEVPQEQEELPPITMNHEELMQIKLNADVRAPHIVFNKEQYEKNLNEERMSRAPVAITVANKSPYSPSDLKAAHNATNIDIAPAVGKKRVIIAITIAHYWPENYLQSCLDAMCKVYNLTPRTLEVIYVSASGAKLSTQDAAVITALNDINTNVIQPIKSHIAANGTPITNDGNTVSPHLIAKLGGTDVSSEHQGKFGWLGELLLDLWAFAINPNADIRIVCAASASFANMFTAIRYASIDTNFESNKNTDVVNMSWIDPAGDYDFADDDAANFNNSKICYFAASGDYQKPGYPGTSPNVLAAGGTSLYYDSSETGTKRGPYNKVWVESDGSGSGAGFALTYPKPAFQSNLTVLNTYTKRCVPDACSVADFNTGVLIFYTDGSSTASTKIMVSQLGGTSLASPILGGLFSHLIQKSHNESGPVLTTTIANIGASVNLQTFLYNKYAFSAANASAMFYDVVDGTLNLPMYDALGGISNSNNSGATFTAGVGYDIPSGLGFVLLDCIRKVLFPSATPINPINPINPVNKSSTFVLNINCN